MATIDPVPERDAVTEQNLKLSRTWAKWFRQLREQINSVAAGWVPSSRRIDTAAPLIGGGTLENDLTLDVNVATTSQVGVVKPDGNTITIDGTGKISAVASGGGSVNSVSGAAPITSTGGANPVIGITASGVTPGAYTNADITVDANGRVTSAANGTGGVTSVGLTMPAEFAVTGSPVTGAGTLAVTKANESANRIYAGPTSGSAAAPTFRAAVVADYPFHDESLCDGFGNFIFDATGDVITVSGIPN